MAVLSDPIILACLILLVGMVVCLLLETVGTPIGARKIGKRTYIAVCAFTASASACAVAFLSPLMQSTGPYQFDRLASIASGLSGVIVTFGIGVAIVHMRHISRERGDGYALFLAAQMATVILSSTSDLLFFTVGMELLMVSLSCLVVFRGTRELSTETSVKLLYGGGIFLLFMALAVFFCCQAAGQTDLAGLQQGLAANNPGAVTAVLLAMVSVFFVLGAAPVFVMHVDFFDGAPTFAAIVFAGATQIAGGAFAMRLCCLPWVNQHLLTLLMVMTVLSLTIPALKGLDQRRVARMCVYLLLLQPGLILAIAALASGDAEMSRLLTPLILVLENAAIVIPGTYAGINFWKQPSHAEKSWEELSGAGRKYPVSTVLWLTILGSIVGIPGTLGFSSRVAIMKLALERDNLTLFAVVGGSIVLGAVPVVRLAIFLFAKPARQDLLNTHQPRQEILLILCGLLVIVGGFLPQLIAL